MSPRRVAGLSSTQMCQAAGVTYRQLDYWCRSGLVRPSHAEAAGQGTRRRWSRDDVAAVAALGAVSARRRLPLVELVDGAA